MLWQYKRPLFAGGSFYRCYVRIVWRICCTAPSNSEHVSVYGGSLEVSHEFLSSQSPCNNAMCGVLQIQFAIGTRDRLCRRGSRWMKQIVWFQLQCINFICFLGREQHFGKWSIQRSRPRLWQRARCRRAEKYQASHNKRPKILKLFFQCEKNCHERKDVEVNQRNVAHRLGMRE